MLYLTTNQTTTHWKDFKTWVSDKLQALIAKIESLAENFFNFKAEVDQNVNSPKHFNKIFKDVTTKVLLNRISTSGKTAWDESKKAYTEEMLNIVNREIEQRADI